jgi:hypothetical protein
MLERETKSRRDEMNEARKVVFGPGNDSLREIFVDGVHFGTCEFDFNADCFWMHGEDPEANYGRTFEDSFEDIAKRYGGVVHKIN